MKDDEIKNLIKPNELSKKAYMAYHNVTESTVSYRMANNTIRWRFLFPETEEYIVIEKDYLVRSKEAKKT
jgi:hypothetical protein